MSANTIAGAATASWVAATILAASLVGPIGPPGFEGPAVKVEMMEIPSAEKKEMLEIREIKEILMKLAQVILKIQI